MRRTIFDLLLLLAVASSCRASDTENITVNTTINAADNLTANESFLPFVGFDEPQRPSSFFDQPDPPSPPSPPGDFPPDVRSNRWQIFPVAIVVYLPVILENWFDRKGKAPLILDPSHPGYDETLAFNEAITQSYLEYSEYIFEATEGLSDHFGDDSVGPLILQPGNAGLRGGILSSASEEEEDEEEDDEESLLTPNLHVKQVFRSGCEASQASGSQASGSASAPPQASGSQTAQAVSGKQKRKRATALAPLARSSAEASEQAAQFSEELSEAIATTSAGKVSSRPLQVAFQASKPFSKDHPTRVQFEEDFVLMICKDYLKFSLIESPWIASFPPPPPPPPPSFFGRIKLAANLQTLSLSAEPPGLRPPPPLHTVRCVECSTATAGGRLDPKPETNAVRSTAGELSDVARYENVAALIYGSFYGVLILGSHSFHKNIEEGTEKGIVFFDALNSIYAAAINDAKAVLEPYFPVILYTTLAVLVDEVQRRRETHYFAEQAAQPLNVD
ncbi:hypothetical protein CYMTET_54391 [Cymbomonas tetramitiformis]|uniref:Uncharacterized protein n=1 Tax=Cymbomonas tetramitiformis TaxID=36881 RepID=A0AAE0BF82_9CHLO|nr:hypothetical protein CYMTET_54391 [Cymbomonas tetramitiformis]